MLTNVGESIYYLEADRISFSFSFSAPKNVFLFFGRKICTYFRCILFFGTNMAAKITENSDAGQIYSDRRSSLLGKNAENYCFWHTTKSDCLDSNADTL